MARFLNRSKPNSTPLERGVLWGVAAAFGLISLTIAISGNISAYFDMPSLLIVGGGTLGAALIAIPPKDFGHAYALLLQALFPTPLSPEQRLAKIVLLAKHSRKDGILSIQHALHREADPFMRKCIELAVDNLSHEEIRRTLEIELAFLENRYKQGAQVFQTMGSIAPAMGLVGTLIGLVQMLQYLDNPSQIGPAMAVALLTTFYGAMLAHILFLPIASKLQRLCDEDMMIKQMSVEGIIDVVRGTNPRLVEQRLHGFLPPETRQSMYA